MQKIKLVEFVATVKEICFAIEIDQNDSKRISLNRSLLKNKSSTLELDMLFKEQIPKRKENLYCFIAGALQIILI